MKRFFSLFAFALLCLAASAIDVTDDPKYYERKWTKLADSFSDDFFSTPEAIRVGDNVLLHQLNSGAWPKNVRMQRLLSDDDYATTLSAKSHVDEGTIDNGATVTEIMYLARLYNATDEKRFLKGVTDGLDYLFKAQYRNGGWPQCYPRTTGYVTEIQYNDNSNENVLRLMRAVFESHPRYASGWRQWTHWTQGTPHDREAFAFLPARYARKAKRAFERGIGCMLRTQIVVDGVPTVWCAQYDHKTLKPAKARAYELISYSGDESFGLIELLLTIPHPSADIVAAVEGAVSWAQENAIHGTGFEYFVNDEGKPDYRMVPCDGCPDLWARFYDIDTCRPFFCDRDGIPVESVSLIGYERRTGYSWYNGDGSKTLKHYRQWRKQLEK